MSFEDINLPKTVIAEIYKNHLVQIITKKENKIVKTAGINSKAENSPQFLGENLKNILILVHYPEMAYLPEEQLDFLIRILTACKLGIGDIAIINTAKEQATPESISMLHAKSILLFGECVTNIVDHKKMVFFAPVNNEGISLITAPALELLSKNTDEGKQLKSKLWLCLQQFFNL